MNFQSNGNDSDIYYKDKIRGEKECRPWLLSRCLSHCRTITTTIITNKTAKIITSCIILSFLILLYAARRFISPHNNNTIIHPIATCETPSLPRGSLHIIIAGYRPLEGVAGLHYSPDRASNYLLDAGLTNADVYFYRRIKPHIPSTEPLSGPCGIHLHERLLLPNHGREAVAFLDHVLEIYHHPPRALMFLHGHGANGWHTSCDAIMARSAYYYRDLVLPPSPPRRDAARARDHMMTLTSPEGGTEEYRLNWMGKVEGEEEGGEPVTRCPAFFDKWEALLRTTAPYRPTPTGKENPYRSCCGSFIVPGERIRRFPLEFWRDYQAFVTSVEDDQWSGRECFEFVIYELLGDDVPLGREEVERLYDEADGLIHGKKRSMTMHEDAAVQWRSKNCEAVQKDVYKQFRIQRRWHERMGLEFNQDGV